MDQKGRGAHPWRPFSSANDMTADKGRLKVLTCFVEAQDSCVMPSRTVAQQQPVTKATFTETAFQSSAAEVASQVWVDPEVRI